MFRLFGNNMNFINNTSCFNSFFIFFFIVFSLISIIIIYTIITTLRLSIKNDTAPRLKSLARIVSKRRDVSGMSEGRTYTDYYITFEFEQGSRKEYKVDYNEYGLLIEGDSGILEHQGSRYLGFEIRH